jgi:hypothetical protein
LVHDYLKVDVHANLAASLRLRKPIDSELPTWVGVDLRQGGGEIMV